MRHQRDTRHCELNLKKFSQSEVKVYNHEDSPIFLSRLRIYLFRTPGTNFEETFRRKKKKYNQFFAIFPNAHGKKLNFLFNFLS